VPEINLMAELDAMDCWCGRDEDVCEENGGCRWSAAMSTAEACTAAAELKLALLRTVLLEGGQDDATARRRALAITGTGEGDRD
jgi:hypothetical protein